MPPRKRAKNNSAGFHNVDMSFEVMKGASSVDPKKFAGEKVSKAVFNAVTAPPPDEPDDEREVMKKKEADRQVKSDLTVRPIVTDGFKKRFPPNVPIPEIFEGLEGGANVLVAGRSGSGKTTLVANMLANPNFPFVHIFDDIHVISPVAMSDDIWMAVTGKISKVKVYSKITNVMLSEMAKTATAHKEAGIPYFNCVVFDDSTITNMGKRNSDLQKLTTISRHIIDMFIIIAHAVKQVVGTVSRQQFKLVVVCDGVSESDRNECFAMMEPFTKLTVEETQALYKQHIAEDMELVKMNIGGKMKEVKPRHSFTINATNGCIFKDCVEKIHDPTDMDSFVVHPGQKNNMMSELMSHYG